MAVTMKQAKNWSPWGDLPDAGGWLKLPHSVLRVLAVPARPDGAGGLGLTDAERVVTLALLSFLRPVDGSIVSVREQELVDRAAVCNRTVRRTMRKLQGFGLQRVERGNLMINNGWSRWDVAGLIRAIGYKARMLEAPCEF